jgi:hypothetical protein
MTVARPMYLRMRFQLMQDAPPIYGVRNAVYVNNSAVEHRRGYPSLGSGYG